MEITDINEEKKEYLWRYKESRKRIRRIELEIKAENETSTLKGVHYDGMPHASGGNNDLSSYFVRLDDMYSELLQEQQRSADIRRGIKERIDRLPTQDEQDVMYLKYLCDYGWKRIASEIDKTVRRVQGIHGEALIHFEI